MKLLRGVIASILFVSATAPAFGQARLLPTDLEYLGAFKLPTGTLTGGDTFEFASGTFCLNAAADGFFIVGRNSEVAEINYPGFSSNPATYPTATLVQSFTEITEGGLTDAGVADGNGTYIAGMCVDPADTTKLIWTVENFYDAESDQVWSLGRSDADFTTPDATYGYTLNGVKPGSTSRWLVAIPTDWRDDFNNKDILVGDGSLSIINRTSSGCPMFGIDAADLSETTAHTRFSDYPSENPLSDPASSSGTVAGLSQDWNFSVLYGGATFVDRGGKQAILVSGLRGTGPVWYGDTELGPGGESDPCRGITQGWHSDGFGPAFWWFGIDEYLDVLATTKQYYEPRPYLLTTPDSHADLMGVFDNTCAAGLGSMAYDPATGRLYVAETGSGDSGTPIIHVYQVGDAAASGTSGVIFATAEATVPTTAGTGNISLATADSTFVANNVIPKASIVVMTGGLTDGTRNDGAVFSVGAADAAGNQWSVGIKGNHGVSPAYAGGSSRDTRLSVLPADTSADPPVKLTHNAFSASTHTLNTTAEDDVQRIVKALFIAGDDADVYVGSQNMPAGTSVVNITAPGAQADLVLVVTNFAVEGATSDDVTQQSGVTLMSVGWGVPGTSQVCYGMAYRSVDADNVLTSSLRTDRIAQGVHNFSQEEVQYLTLGSHASGFTLTPSVDMSSQSIHYVAIDFGTSGLGADVRVVDSPDDAAADWSITDPAFGPGMVALIQTRATATGLTLNDNAGAMGFFTQTLNGGKWNAGYSYKNIASGNGDASSLADDALNFDDDLGATSHAATGLTFTTSGYKATAAQLTAADSTARKWISVAVESPTALPDSDAPVVQSRTINAAGTSFTVVYDEAVFGTAGHSLTAAEGSAPISIASGNGTATHVYTIARPIEDDEVVTHSYTPGTAQDGNGNALVAFSDQAVTNNSTATADVTVPTLSSAIATDDGLTLNFSEAVDLHTGFTLKINGVSATTTYTSGDQSASKFFTITEDFDDDDTLTLDYAAGNVVDLVGNTLAGFTGTSVTNESTTEGEGGGDNPAPKKDPDPGQSFLILGALDRKLNDCGCGDDPHVYVTTSNKGER